MRIESKRLFLILFLLVASGGCYGKRGASSPEPRETNLRVENRSWADMTIFVLDGGRRTRVGDVPANGTRTLKIPDYVVGLGRMLRFQADPLGSANVTSSYEINVAPGQTITLTIPPGSGT